jgi:hypothetical protein
MPPTGWATPEQSTWLQPWLPRFLLAQKNDRPSNFLPGFYQQWFAQFPERDVRFPKEHVLTEAEQTALGADIEARKKVSFSFQSRRLC